MKCKFLMLSSLILGSRQPKNDIDVYLGPIIENLKITKEEEIEVLDAYRQEFFIFQAILLRTINNFLAYDKLLEYSVKNTRHVLYLKKTYFLSN